MNILLVEDEVSLAMIVKDALEEEGYEVAIARDGLEGLEQYFREHPALIIADVMMPEVDGFEMVRGARTVSECPFFGGRYRVRFRAWGKRLPAEAFQPP